MNVQAPPKYYSWVVSQTHITNIRWRTAAIFNKTSTVAETGDRLATIHAPTLQTDRQTDRTENGPLV